MDRLVSRCDFISSAKGQHTLVATLRWWRQEAGGGGLRLPFDPLNRRAADTARPAPGYLGVWTLGGLGAGQCG